MIGNMGSMSLFIAIWVVLLLCYTLLWCLPLGPEKARKYSKKQLKETCFNGLLTCIHGAFLVVLIFAALNIQK